MQMSVTADNPVLYTGAINMDLPFGDISFSVSRDLSLFHDSATFDKIIVASLCKNVKYKSQRKRKFEIKS